MTDYDKGYRDGWQASQEYERELDQDEIEFPLISIPLTIGIILSILGMFGVVRQIELDRVLTSYVLLPLCMLGVGVLSVLWVIRRVATQQLEHDEALERKWADRFPKE